MRKKILYLILVLSLLSGMGNITYGNRAMWDLSFYFMARTVWNDAIATDGINLYTACYVVQAGYTGFNRYNMDGSNPVSFLVPGLTEVRNMAYDGEYFYCVNRTSTIYKVDLANEILISTMSVGYTGMSASIVCITFDPTLDGGNGGFWIGDANGLGAITRGGTPLIDYVAYAGLFWPNGFTYDPYSDPENPCLWITIPRASCDPIIERFDINTLQFTGEKFNFWADNPYAVEGERTAGTGVFAYNNGEGKFLLAISLNTYGCSHLFTLPNVILVYELCDMPLPEAPAPVSNLTVTPGTLGVLNAEIEWTNPTTTEEGGILTQLTAVKIYANGVLIHSAQNPTIGETNSYPVIVSTDGTYTFTLIAENSFGESTPKSVTVRIGHDVPAGPENVTLIKYGTNAELSWTAVTTGLYEGHFTTNGIVYDVYRYPDEVRVSTNQNGTTFSETITQQGYYYYRVVAKNNYGEGGYNDSNIGIFCDVQTLPYFESFEDNGMNFPVCWEQELILLETNWTIREVPSGSIDGNKFAEMRLKSQNKQITKLITPPIDLSGAGNYILSFWMISLGTIGDDILKIYYKTSANGEWILLRQFINESYNWTKKTFSLPNGTDNYFIAFECEINGYGIAIDAISVRDVHIVTGLVTDGINPLEGAKVEVIGTDLFDITNEYGYYEIVDVEIDNHTFLVTKLGYNDLIEMVTIETSITNKDFILTPLPIYSVSGNIKGSDTMEGLEGVTVKLFGYNTYTTTTDEFGNYTLYIYGTKPYNIEVRKNGYEKYISTISVINANVTLDILLYEFASPVVNPVAVENENSVKITWGEPIDGAPEIFRYDSGIANSQLGYYGDIAPRGIFGSCHRVNAAIDKIQWFLTDEAQIPASHVNIYIFELNSAGMPTKNIIHSELMVPTTVMKWCEYVFPEPVLAPNGFFMAISRPVGTFLSIATSNPTVEWPLQFRTHFVCLDFQIFDYIEITQSSYNVNFMIRAEGYSLGKAIQFGCPVNIAGKSLEENIGTQPLLIHSEPFETGNNCESIGSKSFQNYRIYRLQDGLQIDETTWTLLSPNVAELTYTDNEWNTIEEGVYRWAVKAEYTDENISIPRFTNRLIKGMMYSYTVNLTSNSGDPIIGATVKLTNQDGDPEHIYSKIAAGTEVIFANVWKGTYNISIELKGFHPYLVTVVIGEDGLSHYAKLEELIYPVANPLAEIDGDNVKISWFAPIPPIETWINYCVNDYVVGRIGWDDDIGNDMTAAIRFLPSDLENLGIVSGHVITKIRLGIGSDMDKVNLLEIRIWQGGVSVANPGLLVYTQPITNFNSFNEVEMNEVELTSPYVIDATKELRIGYRIINEAGYPFGRDAGPNVSGKGLLFNCSDLGGWIDASVNYGWNWNWSLKAFVIKDSKSESNILTFESPKYLRDYTVYRLEQEQIEDDWTLLSGNITGLTYTDGDWNTLSGGIYQWAIKANYSSGMSDAVLTNALVQNKYKVTFKVFDKENEPIEGALIEFDGVEIEGYIIEGVAPGIYPYSVSKEGYLTNVSTLTVEDEDIIENVTLVSVGIQAYKLSDVILYPNPFTNEINISDPNMIKSVQITNATGQKVKEVDFNGKLITTRELYSGIYFIVIESITGEKVVYKMVKK